jgi:hypothetical protein
MTGVRRRSFKNFYQYFSGGLMSHGFGMLLAGWSPMSLISAYWTPDSFPCQPTNL